MMQLKKAFIMNRIGRFRFPYRNFSSSVDFLTLDFVELKEVVLGGTNSKRIG
jgi:hypothetical protein